MADLTINSKLRMNSGYEIPRLGYGVRLDTFNRHLANQHLCRFIKRRMRCNALEYLDLTYSTNRPASECEAVVKKALDIGYRHVSISSPTV